MLTQREVREAVLDHEWQDFRASLHGVVLPDRLAALSGWFYRRGQTRRAYLQVVNYRNALKRAGLLPVTDSDPWALRAEDVQTPGV